MSYEKGGVSVVFRRIADALELLSDVDLKRLADPQYSLEIKAVRRRAKDDLGVLPADSSVADTIIKITAFSNRRDAQDFLDFHCPSKKSLEVVARALDIPIIRQDKIEDLRDKIVEATVGARIRSQAIQGTGG